MTAPETSHWIKANVTLKHKATLATKTLSFVNRAEIEDVSSDSWPLLVDISNLGVASDRVSILPQSGSIRLIDSIGSFGVDRKFSDLLERYEIRNQTIEILYDQTTTDNNDPSSYTTIFKGKVLNWSIVSDQLVPNITIFFNSQILSKRYISKKISPIDFSSAPTGNYFKTIPIVIGEDVQVRPLLVTSENSTSATYAYATTLASEHVNGGINTYYVQESEGISRTIVSSSAVTTEVMKVGSFTDTTAISSSKPAGGEQAWRIVNFRNSAGSALVWDSQTYPFVLTQIEVWCYGVNDGAAAVSGQVFVKVYDHNQSGDWPGSLLGTAVRDKTDYTANIRGSADFTIALTFDRPIALTGKSTYYYISLGQTETTGDVGTIQIPIYGSATGISNHSYDRGGYVTNTPGEWRKLGSATQDFQYKLYGVKLTDTPSPSGSEINSSGLGHSYFTVTQKTAIASTSNPNVTSLAYNLSIDGLKDDSSGNITGSPSSVITRLHHAVELLEQEYDGSTWEPTGNWDFDVYSDTHTAATSGKFARTIAGSTSGDVTFERWLADACKSLAARPVMRKNGKLAIYYWGTEQSSIKTLTQENSKITRVDALDPSYALTVLKLAYNKSILTFKPENLATEDISKDFQAVIEWYFSANDLASSIIGSAAGLYGDRHNADLYYTWIDSTRSAEALAFYLLSTYNNPPIYVEVTAPLSEMTSAEPMNVIELKHPALPNFDGASSNAKLPDYQGTSVDVTDGYVLTRAKRYRSQIEGMYINFSNDLIPSLVMTTRLLINDKDPT